MDLRGSQRRGRAGLAACSLHAHLTAEARSWQLRQNEVKFVIDWCIRILGLVRTADSQVAPTSVLQKKPSGSGGRRARAGGRGTEARTPRAAQRRPREKAGLALGPGSCSSRRLGRDGPRRPQWASARPSLPRSAAGRTSRACGHVAAARGAKYAAPAILCEKPQRRLSARAVPPPPGFPAPRASAASLISVSRRCSLLTR